MVDSNGSDKWPGSAESNETYHYYRDFSQIEWVRVIFLVVYVLIILCSIFGNGLVLLTMTRQKKLKQNSINFLTCNLAVSDVMVGAFVAPAKLMELTGNADHKLFGSILCTCLHFTQSITIFSTIITLLVVAGERYMVIVHPLRSRRFRKVVRMKFLVGVSWISAFLLSSPNLIPAKDYSLDLRSEWGILHRAGCLDGFDMVHDLFRQSYFMFLTALLYMVPSLLISYVSLKIGKALSSTEFSRPFPSDHSDHLNIPEKPIGRTIRNRRKVAYMMIAVNVAFMACWSPYFIITIVTQFITNFFEQGNFYFTMLCINGFGFLNSAVNPFIYAMAPRFRHSCLLTLDEMLSCFRENGFILSQSRQNTYFVSQSLYTSTNSLHNSRTVLANTSVHRNGSHSSLTTHYSASSSPKIITRGSLSHNRSLSQRGWKGPSCKGGMPARRRASSVSTMELAAAAAANQISSNYLRVPPPTKLVSLTSGASARHVNHICETRGRSHGPLRLTRSDEQR